MTRVVLMDSDVKVTEDTSLINADFDIIILRFIIKWIFFALLLCRTSTQNWHSELWNWVEYSRIIGQSFTKIKSQWMFWPKTIIFCVGTTFCIKEGGQRCHNGGTSAFSATQRWCHQSLAMPQGNDQMIGRWSKSPNSWLWQVTLQER